MQTTGKRKASKLSLEISYFPLCQNNVVFITAVVYFFSWEIDLPCIHLDIESTDFVVGKLLNTTNVVRFSIITFYWQPLPSLLICFLWPRLRSKLDGKKLQPHSPPKWFIDHRRRERPCSLPDEGVIIFPISGSIVFLNVWQTFMVGQPRISSIKINWRCVIFQAMVFPFVWAKQKWKFIRDRCKLSFPPPLAALLLTHSLSACFACHTSRAC